MQYRHNFPLPVAVLINFEYTDKDVLHRAAARGDLSEVKKLIGQQRTDEEKLDFINRRHSLYELTPLALACEFGHESVANYLLEVGASFYATSVMIHRSMYTHIKQHRNIEDIFLRMLSEKVCNWWKFSRNEERELEKFILAYEYELNDFSIGSSSNKIFLSLESETKRQSEMLVKIDESDLPLIFDGNLGMACVPPLFSLLSLHYAAENNWEKAKEYASLSIKYHVYLKKTAIISFNFYEILLKFIQKNKINEAKSLLVEILNKLPKKSLENFKKNFLAMIEHSLSQLSVCAASMLYAVLLEEKRLHLSISLKQKFKKCIEIEKNIEKMGDKIRKELENNSLLYNVEDFLTIYFSYEKSTFINVTYPRYEDILEGLLKRINNLKEKTEPNLLQKNSFIREIEWLSFLINFYCMVESLNNESLMIRFYKMLESIKLAEKCENNLFDTVLICLMISIKSFFFVYINEKSQKEFFYFFDKIQEKISPQLEKLERANRISRLHSSPDFLDAARFYRSIALIIAQTEICFNIERNNNFYFSDFLNKRLRFLIYILEHLAKVDKQATEKLVKAGFKTIFSSQEKDKEKIQSYLIFFRTSIPLLLRDNLHKAIMQDSDNYFFYSPIKEYLIACADKKILISTDFHQILIKLIDFFIFLFKERSLRTPFFLTEMSLWLSIKIKFSRLDYESILTQEWIQPFTSLSKEIKQSVFFSQAFDMIWKTVMEYNVNLLFPIIPTLIFLKNSDPKKFDEKIRELSAVIKKYKSSPNSENYGPVLNLIEYLLAQPNWLAYASYLLIFSSFLQEYSGPSSFSFSAISQKIAEAYQAQSQPEVALDYLTRANGYAKKSEKICLSKKLIHLAEELANNALRLNNTEEAIYFLSQAIFYHKKMPEREADVLAKLCMKRISLREMLAETLLSRQKIARAKDQYTQAMKETGSLTGDSTEIKDFLKALEKRHNDFLQKTSLFQCSPVSPVTNLEPSVVTTSLVSGQPSRKKKKRGLLRNPQSTVLPPSVNSSQTVSAQKDRFFKSKSLRASFLSSDSTIIMVLDREAKDIKKLKQKDRHSYRRFKALFKANPPQVCSAFGKNGFKYLEVKKQWEAKIPGSARLVHSKPMENSCITFDTFLRNGYHQ